MAVSANRLELLQIADAVAREKAIDRQVVISAMEDAIQKAAKSRYGSENEIRAEVDPKTGEIRLARLLEVVEAVTMEATQISLEEARRRNPAPRPLLSGVRNRDALDLRAAQVDADAQRHCVLAAAPTAPPQEASRSRRSFS